MNTLTKQPVLLYTEQTPNPESLKFVSNRMLYANKTADFRTSDLAREWSPLAEALFEFPYVKGVYIANNFVTITKEINYLWEDVKLPLKAFIKTYIEDDSPLINDGFEEAMDAIQASQVSEINYSEDDADTVKKIKELIDTYVKPAVEMDGGNIEFQSYQDGVVRVLLQGSCSGCPSATYTLKGGIEGMLKRMLPQVKEVIAEMEGEV
jgi:NFU1 iron-sulfur cluster scaffold homolog, mitochondrial